MVSPVVLGVVYVNVIGFFMRESYERVLRAEPYRVQGPAEAVAELVSVLTWCRAI